LADYVLVHSFHASVTAAHIMDLALFVAAVLAFAWVIAELVGPRWWRHLLTLAFGESLALLHLIEWWTATANILTATVFGLLAIAGFVRYRRLGRRRWIAVSLTAYLVSLGTHEQAWLVPGYILFFDLFLFAPSGRVRASFARVWNEGWIWLGYIVMTALAMANYFVFYYAKVQPGPTTSELVRYVWIQFTQAFAPSTIGLRPLTTEWTNTFALIVDSIVVLVIVIASIYRSPRAWRVWAVFAVGFLANSLMVGANRVGYFGVNYGKQLYYVQAPAYLFLLCIGIAFSLDRSGEPYVVYAGLQHESKAPNGIPNHIRHAGPRRLWLRPAAAIVALALYGAAFVMSANALNDKDTSSYDSAKSKAYFTTLAGQIRVAESRGERVSLTDTSVPASVITPVFAPFNQLSSILALLEPDVAFAGRGDATFRVTGNGSLLAFHSTAGSRS
jgi:ABC-type multidrug transport system fused ATPase/permease subunit